MGEGPEGRSQGSRHCAYSTFAFKQLAQNLIIGLHRSLLNGEGMSNFFINSESGNSNLIAVL